MSYAHEYLVSGYPLQPGSFTVTSPRELTRQVITVPGKRWATREHWTKREYPYGPGSYRDVPMETTTYWFSPDPEWLAAFKAECEVFEKTGSVWRAERDGYEYHIPERWNVRHESHEWWY